MEYRLLGGTGMRVSALAITFASNHPAVSSTLIGPRTLEHLHTRLPAAARRR